MKLKEPYIILFVHWGELIIPLTRAVPIHFANHSRAACRLTAELDRRAEQGHKQEKIALQYFHARIASANELMISDRIRPTPQMWEVFRPVAGKILRKPSLL